MIIPKNLSEADATHLVIYCVVNVILTRYTLDENTNDLHTKNNQNQSNDYLKR